jgi:ribulose-phosphate 3-epimerase
MKVEIWPSVMCMDFRRLEAEIKALEAAGADGFHLDIMDGHFVPNFTFGPGMLRAVRSVTRLPLDAHLMLEEPDRYIGHFAEAGADLIVVHVEPCVHLHRTLQVIRDAEVRAGVALNPATPPAALEYVLGEVDLVLVMTVDPGFSGQALVESAIPKIGEIARLARRQKAKVRIAVDGHVSERTAPEMVAQGATVLVGGRSGVFRPDLAPAEGLARLRRAVEKRRARPKAR